jgi:hypothetical protein
MSGSDSPTFGPSSPSHGGGGTPSSAYGGGGVGSTGGAPVTGAPSGASSSSVSHLLEFLPEATRFDDALSRPLALGMGEDILLPFVEEYAKLQQALSKSHDSENRFVNKCKALTKQTRAHTHKLTALHAIHLQDAKRKATLQLEIEKARLLLHKLSEEMKEKKEGVRDLRQELQNLGQQLEESSNDYLRSQRHSIAKLELEVNKYTMIRDKDRTGLTKIRSKNVDFFKQLQDLLAAMQRSQQEFDGLEAKLLEARALSGKVRARRERGDDHRERQRAAAGRREARRRTVAASAAMLSASLGGISAIECACTHRCSSSFSFLSPSTLPLAFPLAGVAS